MKVKKKAKRGVRRYGITAEDFVRLWSQSSSIQEVMEKTNMPRNAIYSRVNSYRGKGIKLKAMRRPHKVLNIDALNQIAVEASKKHR